jgi:hypothetical protein
MRQWHRHRWGRRRWHTQRWLGADCQRWRRIPEPIHCKSKRFVNLEQFAFIRLFQAHHLLSIWSDQMFGSWRPSRSTGARGSTVTECGAPDGTRTRISQHPKLVLLKLSLRLRPADARLRIDALES